MIWLKRREILKGFYEVICFLYYIYLTEYVVSVIWLAVTEDSSWTDWTSQWLGTCFRLESRVCERIWVLHPSYRCQQRQCDCWSARCWRFSCLSLHNNQDSNHVLVVECINGLWPLSRWAQQRCVCVITCGGGFTAASQKESPVFESG